MYKLIEKQGVLEGCAKVLAASIDTYRRCDVLLALAFYAKSRVNYWDDDDNDDDDEDEHDNNGKKAMDSIKMALQNDPDENVRRHAAWALGYIKESSAGESLIQALKDKDLGVRHEAVEALAALAKSEVPDYDFIENNVGVPGLVQALANFDFMVRLQAVRHLMSFKNNGPACEEIDKMFPKNDAEEKPLLSE